MKNILFILLALTLITCRSSKSTVEKNDSITISKVGLNQISTEKEVQIITEKIYVPGRSGLTIENPCDSLGNLKDINFNTKAGNFKAQIRNLNGALDINIAEIDTLKNKLEFKEKQLFKQDSINQSLLIENSSLKNTKIIRYRWSKWTYIFLLSTLALLYLLLSKWRSFIPKLF